MKKGMKIHPFAFILPANSREDQLALSDDIRKHGVRVPIVLFEGKILDGRTRYALALSAGITVPVTNFEGTAKAALDLVMSLNVHRRHLTQSQKAVVAADIAKKLQEIDGIPAAEARVIAADATGASQSYVKQAERIIKNEPKKAEKIRNGERTIGEDRPIARHRCPQCGHEW